MANSTAITHHVIISPVVGLEIQKGGFSHWRAKHTRKFLGSHAHFRSRKSPNWISQSNSRTSQTSGDQ